VLLPLAAFANDEPGTLDGTPVLAMSVSGMLAMKEQFPDLRNGRPWRQKDIDDIEILRRLMGEGGQPPERRRAWQTRAAGEPSPYPVNPGTSPLARPLVCADQ
jgi:hypothetical protein